MEIVIDYQSRQNSSRYRGIGRVTHLISKEIVQFYKKKKINFLLNEAFVENIEEVKKEIKEFGDNTKCIFWKPRGDLSFFSKDIVKNSKYADGKLKKIFNKKKIVYLVTGLLDCLHESTYHYIGNEKNIKKFLIFYDLIPFKNKKKYLTNNKFKHLYLKNLKTLKKFKHIFAISKPIKDDLINYINIKPEKISILKLSSDPFFKKIKINKIEKNNFIKKYNLSKKFILYLGPTDMRKNLSKLFESYEIFNRNNPQNIKLVIVGKLGEEFNLYKEEIIELNIQHNVIFTDQVSDSDARIFYNLCDLFVFPSLEEGFGLPLLEAIKCGSNVICTDKPPMNNIIKLKNNLFNPKSKTSIEKLIRKNLIKNINKNSRDILYSHSKKFNWKNTIQHFDYHLKKKLN